MPNDHPTRAGLRCRQLRVAMMVLSAVAYPGWFRLYALATTVVVAGFGMASSLAIRGIEQNDTPWAGGFERINAYAYFGWLVVLAVMVIRHELGSSQPRASSGVPVIAAHGRKAGLKSL